MSLFQTQRPDFLISGERARLIPVIADTSKEGRITSCTLAAFMSVNEFAKGLLDSIGIRLGKTSKVECFTEIVFQNKDKTASKIRPDGLIVVTTGKKQWTALVEAKIGKAELTAEQVESYLDLAKEHKIDAVITLSNQFSATPTHHPITVSKNKLRSVGLYHWSWTFLITEAVMWVKYHGVTDPDQAYILEELVRYLQHDGSGVLSFDSMNGTWKDVCAAVQNRISLKKTSPEVLDSVASWHQLSRNLSLHLGLAVGANVGIFLKKAHKDDSKKRLDDDAALLVSEQLLITEFDVPAAAGRIKFAADVEKRCVVVSMRLRAPEERATTKGRINWLTSQLKKATNPDLSVRAIWPSRAADTMALLSEINEKGADALLCENNSLKPVSFEVVLTRDIGAKFKGSRTFIQESGPLLMEFYEQAGQHLKEWVASAPKIKTKKIDNTLEDEIDETIEKETVIPSVKAEKTNINSAA
ncbi:hypothetical protein N9W34_00190 [Rickettsiales bacterium]|nr:hypothetical protein [Rickettsiales bacterium]